MSSLSSSSFNLFLHSLDGGQKDEGAGRSDQYKKLLDLGLVEQVAAKLDVIYSEGLVKVCFNSFFNKP